MECFLNQVKDVRLPQSLQRAMAAEAEAAREARAKVVMMLMVMLVVMANQHIPTSQNPTRWESDIMMKGWNVTQSNSHSTQK